MAFCKTNITCGFNLSLLIFMIILVSRLGTNYSCAARPLSNLGGDEEYRTKEESAALLMTSLERGGVPPPHVCTTRNGEVGNCDLTEMNFAGDMNEGAIFMSLPRGGVPPPRTETNVPRRGNAHSDDHLISQMNFSGNGTNELGSQLPRGETPPPRTYTNVPGKGNAHTSDDLSEMNFAGNGTNIEGLGLGSGNRHSN